MKPVICSWTRTIPYTYKQLLSRCSWNYSGYEVVQKKNDCVVYDVTYQSSFENLQTWLSECENYCTDQADSIVKLLVANKIDLVRLIQRI